MDQVTEEKEKQKETPLFGSQIRFAIETIKKVIHELKEPEKEKEDKEPHGEDARR